MIVRIWRTGVDPARLSEYRAFATEQSLPMFRQQEGFLGVLFTEGEDGCAVVSLWRDRAAADALESSQSYRDTVAAISNTGFLKGTQTVEILDVTEGHVTHEATEVGA
jgi:heme-degrading monooxygenase HmoA